jgi:hypothetical protein
MGDEFYAIIKLVSGEEIFALSSIDSNDDNMVVILQSPVVIKHINHATGLVIKIKPWIELSNDDIFVVNYDKIVTMTECSDKKIIEIYNNYLESDEGLIINKSSSKIEVSDLSDKMGYVSSVEEARKKLEELFKGPETLPPTDTKDS